MKSIIAQVYNFSKPQVLIEPGLAAVYGWINIKATLFFLDKIVCHNIFQTIHKFQNVAQSVLGVGGDG